MAKQKLVEAPCNECLRDTRHKVVQRHSTEGGDRAAQIWWETSFTMLECGGCGFISLRRVFRYCDDDNVTVQYFPPPATRRVPEWVCAHFMFDSKNIMPPFNEVYSALNADNRMLASMGCRTLIDLAVCDQIGDIGGFAEKLKKLKSLNLISESEHEFLDAAIETGSAAAHRGHCPSREELNHLIDIVEHLYCKIYVLPDGAKKLRSSTPPRPAQPKQTK